jgi:hypothetical protein
MEIENTMSLKSADCRLCIEIHGIVFERYKRMEMPVLWVVAPCRLV